MHLVNGFMQACAHTHAGPVVIVAQPAGRPSLTHQGVVPHACVLQRQCDVADGVVESLCVRASGTAKTPMLEDPVFGRRQAVARLARHTDEQADRDQ